MPVRNGTRNVAGISNGIVGTGWRYVHRYTEK